MKTTKNLWITIIAGVISGIGHLFEGGCIISRGHDLDQCRQTQPHITCKHGFQITCKDEYDGPADSINLGDGGQ